MVGLVRSWVMVGLVRAMAGLAWRKEGSLEKRANILQNK